MEANITKEEYKLFVSFAKRYKLLSLDNEDYFVGVGILFASNQVYIFNGPALNIFKNYNFRDVLFEIIDRNKINLNLYNFKISYMRMNLDILLKIN